MATKPDNNKFDEPSECNGNSKVPDVGTFQSGVTDTPSNANDKGVVNYTFPTNVTSNGNSKCGQLDTFPSSVTVFDEWDRLCAGYRYRSMRGTMIDATPVSCIHCREQFTSSRFRARYHVEKCEAMWLLNQVRIADNMDRKKHFGYRNYCVVRCARCSIDVYSDRKCTYRVCFKCRHKNQLEAVQRCQARYKVKHEERACECCHEAYSPKRSTAKFCSDKCRVAAHRQQRVEGVA